jgi:hypothetical protein
MREFVLFSLIPSPTGIFAVDGSIWKSQRQIASPLFSVKELRHMIPVFVEHGKKVVVCDFFFWFCFYSLSSISFLSFIVGNVGRSNTNSRSIN